MAKAGAGGCSDDSQAGTTTPGRGRGDAPGCGCLLNTRAPVHLPICRAVPPEADLSGCWARHQSTTACMSLHPPEKMDASSIDQRARPMEMRVPICMYRLSFQRGAAAGGKEVVHGQRVSGMQYA